MQVNQRQAHLELFRFIAAIDVVLFHFFGALGGPDPTWSKLPAVDLFFVVSGIVLGAKYGEAVLQGRMSWGTFVWHRLRRLYPLLLLSFLLSWVMSLVGLPEGTVLEARHPQVWGGLLLLPCWHGCDVAFPNNPPTWALFAELAANAGWFWCLVLAPALIEVLGAVAGLVFLLAVAFSGYWHIGWSPGVVGVTLGILRALAFFVLGYSLNKRQIGRHWSTAWVLLAFALVMSFYATGWPPKLHAGLGLLPVALAGAFLLAHLFWRRTASQGWATRLSIWLGGLSYPIYLNQAAAGRLGEYLMQTHQVPAWFDFLVLPVLVAVAMQALYKIAIAPWLEPWLASREA